MKALKKVIFITFNILLGVVGNSVGQDNRSISQIVLDNWTSRPIQNTVINNNTQINYSNGYNYQQTALPSYPTVIYWETPQYQDNFSDEGFGTFGTFIDDWGGFGDQGFITHPTNPFPSIGQPSISNPPSMGRPY
jgi:hypothetical protein